MGDADAVGGSVHAEPNGPRPTPGPWAYVPRPGGYSITGDGGRVVLCDDEQYYPTAPPERDARLIAAAPDLLAALEAIIYASDGCVGHRACNHSVEPWRQARVAIAKAVGA